MIGRVLARYRIVRELGRGGMGTVYEAVHVDLGRKVAIKILRGEGVVTPEKMSRFFNEARAASKVEHRSIVSVMEFSVTDEGYPYIIMEFLAGDSLRDRMRSRPAEVGRKFLPIVRQIASALAATHKKQIIHRDLKPDNIMLVPDEEAPGGERVKLLDFGIAKLASEDEEGGSSVKTRTGQLLGTPTYMAPEQCRGTEELTDKVDVYALGILMYEMLTGRPPFRSTGVGELMAMHMFADVQPIQTLLPSIDPALQTLLASMLTKSAQVRPTMERVAEALVGISETGIAAGGASVAGAGSGSGFELAATMDVAGSGASAEQISAQIRQQLGDSMNGDKLRTRTDQIRGQVFRRTGVLIAGASAVALLLGYGGLRLMRTPPVRPASVGVAAPGPTMVPATGMSGSNVVASASDLGTAAPPGAGGTAPVVAAAGTAPSRGDTGATDGAGAGRVSASEGGGDGAADDDLEEQVTEALDKGNPKVALRLLRKAPRPVARKKSMQALLCKTLLAMGQGSKAARPCRDAGMAAPGTESSTTTGAETKSPTGETPAAPTGGGTHDVQVDYLR